MKKLNRLWTAVLVAVLLLSSMSVYANDTNQSSETSEGSASTATTSTSENSSSTASNAGATNETSKDTTVTLPEQGANRYCHDFADALSQEAEDKITAIAKKLKEKCEIIVVTTKNGIDNSDELADFTEGLFDKWEVGTKETEKGVLFVMDITGDNYFSMAGPGIVKYFPKGVLKTLLDTNVEPMFIQQKYGEAAAAFVQQIEVTVSAEPVTTSSATSSVAKAGGVGAAIWGVIKVILIIILIVILLAIGFFVFMNLRAQSIKKKRGTRRRTPHGGAQQRSARPRTQNPSPRTGEGRPRRNDDNRRDL